MSVRQELKEKQGPDAPRFWGSRALAYVALALVLALGFIAGQTKLPSASFFNSETISEVLVQDASQTAIMGDMLAALGLSQDSPVKILQLPGGKSKTLHGRFLHITDIHPDPHYKTGSSAADVCHSGKPDKKKDTATRFGVAMNGCDSSMDLMEYTLKWVEDNLKDKIDFVVWTGDNIRHDNDRKIPRTESQIFELNEEMAHKFEKMFRRPNSADPRDFAVDVVPSLGNNDVFPHNLFSLGPTLQTREIYNMWSNFVPQEQQRAFARGTSFFVEVIPGKLAVLSIQTLYLYKANPLVDSCNSKKQPGYQLLLWLGYVLEELRSRNMKVWLTGHVPPILKNYEESCYHKYTLWTNEYRDVIIGGLYGHMNMDHFVPVDGKKSWKAIDATSNAKTQEIPDYAEDEDDFVEFDKLLESAVEASDVRIMGAKPVNKGAYMDSVREMYYKKIASRMADVSTSGKNKKNKKKNGKKKKKKDGSIDRYSIVNIAGSVIPTFNPAFRVWEYNISGLDSEFQSGSFQIKGWDDFFQKLEVNMERDLRDEEKDQKWSNIFQNNRINNKVDKSIPTRMPADLNSGPGYTPQLFSPTRFIQYYADLETIEKNYKKALKDGSTEDDAATTAFEYQVEYSSDDEPYRMKSLLTKDYIKLAVKLAKYDELWDKYTERAFLSTGYTD
ncbi:LANO_0H12112g1_1 [Lachancea nothofagi CBS 11611]|uniref:Endopolyphosphatase n=1 Tax=Lachancea nothofagi CBS 11611 TaxID=1266666 RepID=A0A1G4KMK6_9SACH|nr:LANO_0H12112g1_1 [Lachancea nothofagi CBS 11611]